MNNKKRRKPLRRLDFLWSGRRDSKAGVRGIDPNPSFRQGLNLHQSSFAIKSSSASGSNI